MQYIAEFNKLLEIGSTVLKAGDEISVFYEPGTTLTIEQHLKINGLKGKITYMPIASTEEELFAIGGIAANSKGGAVLMVDSVNLSDAIMEKYQLSVYEPKKSRTAKKETTDTTVKEDPVRKAPVTKKKIVVEDTEATDEKTVSKAPPKAEKEPVKAAPADKKPSEEDLFGGTSNLFEEAHSEAPDTPDPDANDYYGNIAKFTETLGVSAKDYGINTPEGMFVLQLAQDITSAKDDNDLQRKLMMRYQDRGPKIWANVKKFISKLRPIAENIIASQ